MDYIDWICRSLANSHSVSTQSAIKRRKRKRRERKKKKKDRIFTKTIWTSTTFSHTYRLLDFDICRCCHSVLYLSLSVAVCFYFTRFIVMYTHTIFNCCFMCHSVVGRCISIPYTQYKCLSIYFIWAFHSNDFALAWHSFTLIRFSRVLRFYGIVGFVCSFFSLLSDDFKCALQLKWKRKILTNCRLERVCMS